MRVVSGGGVLSASSSVDRVDRQRFVFSHSLSLSDDDDCRGTRTRTRKDSQRKEL